MVWKSDPIEQVRLPVLLFNSVLAVVFSGTTGKYNAKIDKAKMFFHFYFYDFQSF